MHHVAAAMMGALVGTGSEFHIAPMQCYTNQPLRKMCGLLSPSSVKWTEMEKVDDLLPNIGGSLKKRLDGEQDDDNLILQLGSNDVDKLDRCIKVAANNFPNLKEINLNCGTLAIHNTSYPCYLLSLTIILYFPLPKDAQRLCRGVHLHMVLS